MQMTVPAGSRLHGVYLPELRLPADAAVVLIVRDGPLLRARRHDPADARGPGAAGVGAAVAAGGRAPAARGQPGGPAGQLARRARRRHRDRLRPDRVRDWRRRGRRHTMTACLPRSSSLDAGRRRPPRSSCWRAGRGRVGRWAALPRGGRRLVAGLAVLVLLAGGALCRPELVGRAGAPAGGRADRDLRRVEFVDLAAGGEVRFFLLVRNDGPLPVSVTSVTRPTPGCSCACGTTATGRSAPGRRSRSRCRCGSPASPVPGRRDRPWPPTIGVRREDGGSTSRRVDLRARRDGPGRRGDPVRGATGPAGPRAVRSGPAGSPSDR